jgi:hypothetical protein
MALVHAPEDLDVFGFDIRQKVLHQHHVADGIERLLATFPKVVQTLSWSERSRLPVARTTHVVSRCDRVT